VCPETILATPQVNTCNFVTSLIASALPGLSKMDSKEKFIGKINGKFRR